MFFHFGWFITIINDGVLFIQYTREQLVTININRSLSSIHDGKNTVLWHDDWMKCMHYCVTTSKVVRQSDIERIIEHLERHAAQPRNLHDRHAAQPRNLHDRHISQTAHERQDAQSFHHLKTICSELYQSL